MNKLVEYLAEHHHPGGSAFKIVSFNEISEEMELSVEELHYLTLEADREEMIMFSQLNVKGDRWGVDQMILGDIDYMAVTNKGIKWYKDLIASVRA